MFLSHAADRKPLVLVVDDSPDARKAYGEYLASGGFCVAFAEDGQAGIDSARRQTPSAIVMDLTMPRVDGWQAIRQLRSDPATAGIPIVALSEYAFGREPIAAREAGADLCLSTPADAPQVAGMVRALIVAGHWRLARRATSAFAYAFGLSH